MEGKLRSSILGVLLMWCVSDVCGEAPLAYLQAPFPGISQPFVQTGGASSFGFTAPTAYSTTGYAASKLYLPKKTYIQPKIYQIPIAKYNLQTTGFGLSATTAADKGYEEDYHHGPAHYEYHYNVHDHHHGTEFGHKEYREGHVAKGQYVVLLPDGRRQIVDYVADSRGYRPTIRYESGYDYR